MTAWGIVQKVRDLRWEYMKQHDLSEPNTIIVPEHIYNLLLACYNDIVLPSGDSSDHTLDGMRVMAIRGGDISDMKVYEVVHG